MCGRLNVTDSPLVEWICDELGIPFTTQTNKDLRPSQQVDTIAMGSQSPEQITAFWGIKPSWSKKLLINAQAETVADKPTFKHAFASSRCLVPCTGWYEWRDEGGPRKQRYAFTSASDEPFLMAGILFAEGEPTELVTLTTRPTPQCGKIHHRMPVLIPPESVNAWLGGSASQAGELFSLANETSIEIEKR